MRWERFFEDLEVQLSSEREQERAELDSEALRVRLARTTLTMRLACVRGRIVSVRSVGAESAMISGLLCGVGQDWLALGREGDGTVLFPLAAIEAIGLDESDLVASAFGVVPAPSPVLAERMSLGFLLRHLARRRTGVAVHTQSGRVLTGTIDRAGADHLDLALHDPGSPRRDDNVTAYQLVPCSAIGWIFLDRDARAV